MRKMMRTVFLCFLAALFFQVGTLLADRQLLGRQLIRFHVVANSDNPGDQLLKLQVRDAVLEELEQALADVTDVAAARAYLQNHLDQIRQAADQTLEKLGCTDRARVSLDWEAFCARACENLSLPAGLYQALRITIGEGAGQNWWGVLFPQLYSGLRCDAALPASLTDSLTGRQGTEIRFFLLDKLGQLENSLRKE